MTGLATEVYLLLNSAQVTEKMTRYEYDRAREKPDTAKYFQPGDSQQKQRQDLLYCKCRTQCNMLDAPVSHLTVGGEIEE